MNTNQHTSAKGLNYLIKTNVFLNYLIKTNVSYGVRKWTKLPIPFRGVAAPLRGANHITVSSCFRFVVFILSWRRVFVSSFFCFVVASCFRFVAFISSWGPVCFVVAVVTGHNWSAVTLINEANNGGRTGVLILWSLCLSVLVLLN